MSTDGKDRAKGLRKSIGQVKRNYGKAGVHEDKRLKRQMKKGRKHINPSDPSTWEDNE